MVEIRKLQPSVRIRGVDERPALPVDHQRRVVGDTPRKNYRFTRVERLRKDHLPPTPQPTPCVIWQGPADRHGYGRYGRKAAHRWIIEYAFGIKLSSRDVVLHACDNPICFRLDHLSVGTIAANNLDARNKGRAKKPPVNPSTGEHNNQAQLTWAIVRWIRAEAGRGRKTREIHARLVETGKDVTPAQVARIISGKRWPPHTDPERGPKV